MSQTHRNKRKLAVKELEEIDVSIKTEQEKKQLQQDIYIGNCMYYISIIINIFPERLKYCKRLLMPEVAGKKYTYF